MALELKSKTKNLSHVEIASLLFHIEVQIHVFHLGAKSNGSFAVHMALNGLYSGIQDQIDSLVETLQGKTKSLLKGYLNYPYDDYENKEQVIKYITDCLNKLESYRVSLPSNFANIDNQVQVIIDSLESTVYKLTFLQ